MSIGGRPGRKRCAASGKRGADLVICDIRLPDIEGQALFRQLASSISLPPFLFITAYGDIDQAVSLMREGAADYITKPFDVGSVIGRIRTLIQRNTALKPGAVLGVSPAIRNVENTLRRICDLTSPLLITGETGAGKEVCARFLHAISLRSKEPFIAVNCAAIPADVMERELFGYRGAGRTRPFTVASPSGRGAACCFWTKWRNCRLAFRPNYCASWRLANFIELAASS